MPEDEKPWIVFIPSKEQPGEAYFLHSMHWDEKQARRVAEGLEGAFVSQSQGAWRQDID